MPTEIPTLPLSLQLSLILLSHIKPLDIHRHTLLSRILNQQNTFHNYLDNLCYCIASHGAAARKAGMNEAMFGELMAVVGMANETNRLANGYRVPIDPAFEK